MIRLYIIGISILIVAILANAIAIKLGIKTWYDFLGQISNDSLSGVKSLSAIDFIWLFILYPLSLGVAYWIGDEIYKLF
ncbi:MAG: hypothetical protein AAGH46_08190 [Bacteroidota bacterium]